MTQHRLISCHVSDVVEHIAQLSGTLSRPAGAEIPRWLPGGVPRGGAMVGWRQRLPGPGRARVVDCCLEVEPAANGVLAHLSAKPAGQRSWPLPPRLSGLALRAWTASRLAALAGEIEADTKRGTTAA